MSPLWKYVQVPSAANNLSRQKTSDSVIHPLTLSHLQTPLQ